METIEQSDFYIAPASTMYHGNYEGGLCDHSVHVFEELSNLNDYYWWRLFKLKLWQL